MLNKINARKLIVRLLLILLSLGIVGTVMFDRQIRKYGYDGASDFVANYWENKNRVHVEPIHLNIRIADEDWVFIKSKRQEALERGVQINIGNNYVSCDVQEDEGSPVKGVIRLKGHMIDHLEGDKWSYRVKTDKPVMGMYRFSLQHPGTRNYAYEWVYHQLLKQEGIIHLKYNFIQLSINEGSKGIYAVEEHFGQHVLAHNDRPKGAILRWNPELYWEWRIDEMKRIYLDENYGDYSSSIVEPYDKGVITKDEELLDTYLKGAALLEAFRRDSLTAKEVFDIDKLARFHAIIDLVGGYHSLDWSDIKFYYNSKTGLMEPVGYESFSVRLSEHIAGQRVPDGSLEIEMDYHDKIFSDMDFFKLYIQHLERIADEAYMNKFIQVIDPELKKNLSILAIEWPYRKFSFDPYFKNIELIRHNLELPKPLHAFTENISEDSIYVSIAPVTDYPIEIYKVDINDRTKLEIDPYYLPAKKRNSFAQYYDLVIPNQHKKVSKIELFCKIPGSCNNFKVEVNNYPSYRKAKESSFQDGSFGIEDANGVAFSNRAGVYYFKERNVVIDRAILVSSSHKLQFSAGQQIEFIEAGKLIIEGELMVDGDEEIPVSITSGTLQEVIMIKPSGRMVANHLEVFSLNKLVAVHGGYCEILNSQCYDVKNLFSSIQGQVYIGNLYGGKLERLGDFDRSDVTIFNTTVSKGDTLIVSTGSNFKIRSSTFKESVMFASLDHISEMSSWGVSVSSMATVAELNNSSNMKFYASSLSDAQLGFSMDLKTNSSLPSKYTIYRTSVERLNQLEEL